MEKKRTKDVWVLIGIGILLNIMYLVGLTMSVINYDFTVSVGLQEPASEITEIGVAFNKGFGLGDSLFYMPVFIIGIIGLIRKTSTGFYMMIGAMAITVYWPIVCLTTVYFAKGSPGWGFSDYTSYTILLSLIAIYGLWGMWYLISHRNTLMKE